MNYYTKNDLYCRTQTERVLDKVKNQGLISLAWYLLWAKQFLKYKNDRFVLL